MRRYRKSLQIGLLVVIAAFVASLFVFGTSGSRMGGGEARDRVATVNGESIPIERFQRRYQSYLEAYAQMYRDRFTNELAERLGLPLQVVGDLVQEALIVQRAQAEGLAVTDEELNARIHAIPGFQENGRFSLKRYQEILKRRGFNPAAFEGEIRRELTRAKVESAVRSGVKVSETELEQAFRMRREEVRAAWALVELAPIVAAASATDEELATYLAGHPDEFRQPDRRRVQYVTLSPKSFTPTVTDAEVEKYYREHAKEFESPRQDRAARRRPRARDPRRGGAAVRAGAVRVEERRGVTRAGPYAVRLPRDQGVRHPRGRSQAPEGRRGPDPEPPLGRGGRPGGEGEGRADPAAPAGREGLHGRGEEARARAGRDDHGSARSRARSRRRRHAGGGGVRPRPGRRVDSADHAGGPGPDQGRGGHSRGCAPAR